MRKREEQEEETESGKVKTRRETEVPTRRGELQRSRSEVDREKRGEMASSGAKWDAVDMQKLFSYNYDNRAISTRPSGSSPCRRGQTIER